MKPVFGLEVGLEVGLEEGGHVHIRVGVIDRPIRVRVKVRARNGVGGSGRGGGSWCGGEEGSN